MSVMCFTRYWVAQHDIRFLYGGELGSAMRITRISVRAIQIAKAQTGPLDLRLAGVRL
jgi:hypothetical protein